MRVVEWFLLRGLRIRIPEALEGIVRMPKKRREDAGLLPSLS